MLFSCSILAPCDGYFWQLYTVLARLRLGGVACVMWSSEPWAKISALSLVSCTTTLSLLRLCQASVLLVAWSLDQKLQALNGSSGYKDPKSLNCRDGVTTLWELVSARWKVRCLTQRVGWALSLAEKAFIFYLGAQEEERCKCKP